MLFRLMDELIDQETLVPQTTCELPRSIVYTNEAEFDRKWAAYGLSFTYVQRTASCEPIVLGKVPSGTMLCGNHHFLLQLGTRVATELPHALRDQPELIRDALATSEHIEDLDQECVLLTRWGHGTWG